MGLDPRDRLTRRVPGEAMLEPRPGLARMFGREQPKESKFKPLQHREPVVFKVRTSKLRSEAGPYAPQLIRLIRKRFQEVPTRFQKTPLVVMHLESLGQGRLSPNMRAAMGESHLLPFPRPTDRPRLTPRERLSSARYLALTQGKES